MNIIKKRLILAKIYKQLDNDLVLILIGARQVGKSYILKAITDYVISHFPNRLVLYFDLEKPEVLKDFEDYRSAVGLFAKKGATSKSPAIILLDEFQKMPTPTKTLKIIHDHYPYLKIIATGSSSLDIFSKLRAESMAGRKRVFDVFPLDFIEYLDFTEQHEIRDIYERLLTQNLNSSIMNYEVEPPWAEHAIWGGYPRVALSATDDEKKSTLSELQKSYLERDISGLLGSEDSIGFNKFVSLLAAQSANLLNVNEISKILGLSRFIAEKYIFLLEQTFIIKLITPYYSNKHKEVVKMPKIYFLDNGLRNWILQNFTELEFRPDKGQLVENAVFIELYKHLPLGSEICFWRTPQGAEVDFVITQGQKLTPVEVKYQPIDRPVLPSGLKTFIKKYHPSQAFVVTRNYDIETDWQKCKVRFLPVFIVTKILSLL